MADLGPAARLLRAHDPARFRTTLFAMPPARDALIALFALDCEIARVRHVVSQPITGLIRLQWWRDALEGITHGQPLDHPVVRALATSWPLLVPHRAVLEKALDARESELEPAPLATLAGLEGHLEATAGAIGRVAAAVLGADQAADAAAGVARAWATVNLLAEIEADRRQGRTMLPAGLLAAHGVDPERIGHTEDSRALRVPVQAVAGLAEEALRQARALGAPAQALPAVLLAPVASRALRRLADHHYDHRSPWRRPSPFDPLRLLWGYARGRF